MLTLNFSSLPIKQLQKQLQDTSLYRDLERQQNTQGNDPKEQDTLGISESSWVQYKQQWQDIQLKRVTIPHNASYNADDPIESLEVNWLIKVFNQAFVHHDLILVRGKQEPEYFPATQNQPARIEFAHGFFRSALHEISHWSLAGARRRTLPDFGYWYAPDGRTEAQQHEFERVEIKPQAIECLLALACNKNFEVSQDNLHADFDTSQSTFKQDVYAQAQAYIAAPSYLPTDAQRLLTLLTYLCHATIE